MTPTDFQIWSILQNGQMSPLSPSRNKQERTVKTDKKRKRMTAPNENIFFGDTSFLRFVPTITYRGKNISGDTNETRNVASITHIGAQFVGRRKIFLGAMHGK